MRNSSKMAATDKLNSPFLISRSKENVICPPDQVFSKQEFSFLITIGHHLVDNQEEYSRFISLLIELGESEFYVLENLGATVSTNADPFYAVFPINTPYNLFEQKIEEFDPPFGFDANHFYVFGQTGKWGIYLCEYPTVNIIGAGKELIEKFREVFKIKGTGLSDLEPFLDKEYKGWPEFKAMFLKNYDLVQ
jgi:hypothetical protein